MKSENSQTRILVVGNGGMLSRELVRLLSGGGNEVHSINFASNNTQNSENINANNNTISYTNVTHYQNPNAAFNIILSNFLEAPENYNVQQNLYNEEKLYKFIFDNNLLESRTLLVYPQKKLAVYKEYTDALLASVKKKENTGVLLLGEILDLNLPKRSDLLLNKLLHSVAEKKVAAPKKEFHLHPVTYQTAASHIIKNLFSFGPNNLEKVFLAGPQITVSNLLAIIAAENEELEFYYDNYDWNLAEHVFDTRELVQTDVDGLIKQIVSAKKKEVNDIPQITKTKLPQSSMSNTAAMPPAEDVPIKPEKRKGRLNKFLSFKKRKPILYVFSLILLFVGVPYLAYAGSTLLMQKPGGTSSLRNVSVAKVLGVSAVNGFESRSSVPILGDFEKKYLDASRINTQLISINSSLSETDQKYEELLKEISKGFKKTQEADALARDYKNIYEKTLFVLAKNENQFSVQYNELNKIKEHAYANSILLPELHELAGFNDKKTYMLILQDERELRASGGYILAAGSVTVENAQITDFFVSDIYSLNKQFSGEIEAPSDMQKYLGKRNLQMHDANWAVDFKDSALTLETFYQSSGGGAVDGVIAVDIEFLKSLLNTHDISVDENKVTPENIYELIEKTDSKRTATEDFIAELTGVLLANIQNTDNEEYANINLFEMFNQKHIQASLNFTNLFSSLKWDGGVHPYTCSGNCYSDIFGIIESNVGLTKTSGKLERSLKLNANLQVSSINKNAELVFVNSSNEVYKNYIRLLVTPGSVFAPIELQKGNNTESVSVVLENINSQTTAGFYLEIKPQERVSANISWSNPVDYEFESEGQYVLNLRKQPGVNPFPVQVNLNTSHELESNLTNGVPLRYNTNLTSDERYEVHWN